VGYPVLGNLRHWSIGAAVIYHNNISSYARLCIESENDTIYERVIPCNESLWQSCSLAYVQTLVTGETLRDLIELRIAPGTKGYKRRKEKVNTEHEY